METVSIRSKIYASDFAAVYDAVEKVGSLVARIVLAPLEEMCFAYFSNAINKNSRLFMKSTVRLPIIYLILIEVIPFFFLGIA